MQHKEEASIILAFGMIATFIPGLLMGDSFAALQFALAFNVLFILPLIPWVLLLNWNAFERFALAAVLGVSGVPIMFFFIGVVHGPMTLLTFLGVPLLVFAAGMFALKRKRQITHEKSAHHAPAQTSPQTIVVQSSETKEVK